MVRVVEIRSATPPRPSPLVITLMLSPVQAGFPSPAEEYVECRLDVADYLVKHPAATYFLRVQGDSMRGAGIHCGDLLVVDRSVDPRHGHVVVAAINGLLTVKRLHRCGDTATLRAENESFPPILLAEHDDVQVWGVVTAVIHRP